MFGPKGEVLQPSEALFRKAVLVERGSFRPVTQVHVDMLNCATAQFIQEPEVHGKDVVVLMEITMNNLLATGLFDGTSSAVSSCRTISGMPPTLVATIGQLAAMASSNTLGEPSE